MIKRKIIGVFIIILGVLLFLNAIDLIEIGNLFKYWPVLLILIGMLNIYDRGGVNIGGVILTLIGTIFLIDVLNIPILEDIDWWELIIPMIIIVVGIKVLFPGGLSKPRQLSQDFFTQTVLFGGADIEPTSEAFSGGDPVVLFGGMDLDLSKCKLASTRPVRINAFVAFGGMDIYVPSEWSVRVKGLPLFGGINNRATKASDANQVDLIIDGIVIFGGIEVKHKKAPNQI